MLFLTPDAMLAALALDARAARRLLPLASARPTQVEDVRRLMPRLGTKRTGVAWARADA
jgi:hypothetical protein